MSFNNTTIAFVIYRLTSLRLAGTAIIEAKRKGCLVELWLDYGDDVKKSYHGVACEEAIPNEIKQDCKIVKYNDWNGLKHLIQNTKVDIIINNIPLRGMKKEDWEKCTKKPLVVLHDGAPLDWVHNIFHIEEFECIDLFAICTEFWIKKTLVYLKSHLEKRGIKFTIDHENYFLSRAKVVSWSVLDQVKLINTDNVRKEYDIPENKKVVCYFNWTQGLKAVSQRAAMFSICSKWKKIKNVKYNKQCFRNYIHSIFDPSICDVLKQIKLFCKRNNAILIGRFRERDRGTEHVSELKYLDKIVYDDSYYPLSIIKLLKISDLSIGYLSAAVRESIGCQVPHMTLNVAGLGEMPICDEQILEKKMWNYKGLVWNCKNWEFSNILNNNLDDFKIEIKSFVDYYKTYIGTNNDNHSLLFIETILKMLQQHNKN